MAQRSLRMDWLEVPRDSVRFPLEWRPSHGFDPEDRATWPALDGRL